MIETPGQRTMKQWFQGKLAERLLVGASIAENTATLRRGARKMQDGTFGEPTGDSEGRGEDMRISVGDTYYQNLEPPPPTPPTQPGTQPSLLSKALPYVLAAALGGGGALALLTQGGLQGGDKPAAEDRDTTRLIDMGKFIP